MTISTMNVLYLISALALIFPLASPETENYEEITEKPSPTEVLERLDQYLLLNHKQLGIKSVESIIHSCPAVFKETLVNGQTVHSVNACLNITNLVVASPDFTQGKLEIKQVQLNVTINYKDLERPKVTLDMDSPFVDVVSVYIHGEEVIITEIEGILLDFLKNLIGRKVEEFITTSKPEM
ncbi:hypothetical protein ACTXT7_007903 [Hymenolepis weldensis]